MPNSAIELVERNSCIERYRSGSSVLVFDQYGRVLLVRKDRMEHAWQAPQGGRHTGETPGVAAIRELREEVGLILTPDQLIYFGEHLYDWSETVQTKRNGIRGQLIRIFLAALPSADQQIQLQPEEVAEYRWVSKSELKKLVDSKPYKNLLLEAMNWWRANKPIIDLNQPKSPKKRK